MPKQAQKERQDGKALTLGVLYLLDNLPGPPEDMEWHEYSGWAIAEHLKRHSYYYHTNTKRTLATTAKMRSRILGMCSQSTEEPIPERGHGYKDKVAFVLAEGGTDLFRRDFLKDQGYKKGKLFEGRLNKHVSEVNTSGGTEIDGRPEDTPATAMTDGRPEGVVSEERSGSDASKTSRHFGEVFTPPHAMMLSACAACLKVRPSPSPA